MARIAVVGAGVVGLSAAVEIQEKLGPRGKVTIFAEKFSPDTTGDVSAGLWTPYLLQNTPKEDIIEWAGVTQEYFKNLWRNGFGENAGISLQPVLCLTGNPEKSPTWGKIAIGLEMLEEHCLQKVGKEHNTKYNLGYSYMAFVCEPTKFLPFLEKQFVDRGGELVKRKIENFQELADFDAIVNCAGLNARHLTGDKEVIPIRGQVARVRAPWNYQVLFDDDFYIIPNTNCTIMGGTQQKGDEDLKVRDTDVKFITNGCTNLIPALKHAKLFRHMAGLRPGRSRVRVELEQMSLAGKRIPVVHNYGHGGSGVTLCRGCAVSAGRLLCSAVGVANSKL